MVIGAPSMYAAFGDKKALFDEVVEVYSDVYGSFAGRALDEEPTVRGASSGCCARLRPSTPSQVARAVAS
jgi:AcrR family transcriptional regulator